MILLAKSNYIINWESIKKVVKNFKSQENNWHKNRMKRKRNSWKVSKLFQIPNTNLHSSRSLFKSNSVLYSKFTGLQGLQVRCTRRYWYFASGLRNWKPRFRPSARVGVQSRKRSRRVWQNWLALPLARSLRAEP